MNNFSFWSDWEKSYRLFFVALSALVLLFLVSFLIIHFGDISFFYQWQITGYLEKIAYPIFSNHSDMLESVVYTDLPLILQKAGSDFQYLPSYYTYIYLVLLYLGLSGFMAITTLLKKFWYYISMGLFIVFISLSGVSEVGIFGFYGKAPIVFLFVIFVSTSYYYNAIRTYIGLGQRFLVFVGLFALTFLAISWQSEVQSPLLHIARYSYIPAMILIIIFIVSVAHEVVYGILLLTTPSTKQTSSNNTPHFVILSTVYLLNLILLYLSYINYLNWDIYYINEYFLLITSTFLGLWGLKSREERYDSVLPFYPYAALLFLCLAAVTFGSLLYFSVMANDPFLEAIEQIILYAHIGFGFMFFLYIIANFLNQLRMNQPVYRIAYKENNFPYISARIAGAVIVAALFFRANYSSMNLAIAGYYNGFGDLYKGFGDQSTGDFYYNSSMRYSINNHHANFVQSLSVKDKKQQLKLIERATKKKPSAFAYANLGRMYESNNQFFEAIFSYQAGLEEFPNHWALQNNLALLYSKTDVLDSTIYYLRNSDASGWKAATLSANLAAICAVNGLPVLDYLDDTDSDRFDMQNNVMAAKLALSDTTMYASFTKPEKSTLNLYTYSYLKNLGITSFAFGNRNYLNLIDVYLAEPKNSPFKSDLMYIKAINYYAIGRISEAFNIIRQLNNLDQGGVGQWDALLGKWCMELGKPLQASKYFEKSREWFYPNTTSDLSQSYSLISNQSVAAFLVNRTLSEDTLTDLQYDQWRQLSSRIEQNKISWSGYDFEKERAQLSSIASMETTQKSIEYLQLSLDNPFFEDGVLAAVNFYQNELKDGDEAYRILLNAIEINSYSPVLIKAYIAQCLKVGLVAYAESTVIRLLDILPVADYEAYEVQFEDQLEIIKAEEVENW